MRQTEQLLKPHWTVEERALFEEAIAIENRIVQKLKAVRVILESLEKREDFAARTPKC